MATDEDYAPDAEDINMDDEDDLDRPGPGKKKGKGRANGVASGVSIDARTTPRRSGGGLPPRSCSCSCLSI